MTPLAEPENRFECVWEEEFEDDLMTGCGRRYVFSAGPESDFRFCSYCGGRLRYVLLDDLSDLEERS